MNEYKSPSKLQIAWSHHLHDKYTMAYIEDQIKITMFLGNIDRKDAEDQVREHYFNLINVTDEQIFNCCLTLEGELKNDRQKVH